MFAKAETHVDTIGAATSPPPAAILDKEDTDADDAVDAREVRDDDAAKDILEVILMLLLKMLLPLPKERRSDEQEIAAVIM